MENEIWKDVKGYEGLYQVSNLGRVKSLKFNKEKILKPGVNSTGYYNVLLYKDSIAKSVKVHQLVAIAFLNHNPCGYKIVVDHLNNNPLDNKLENLQMITARENTSKDKKNKTSKYKGVSWYESTQKWEVKIRIKSKKLHLGYFNCELAAHQAYQNKLKEISC